MKTKLTCIFILTIALITFCQISNARDNYYQCYSDGKSKYEKLMKAGKYEEAYQWAKNNMVPTSPVNTTLVCNDYHQGLALTKMGRYVEAANEMAYDVFQRDGYQGEPMEYKMRGLFLSLGDKAYEVAGWFLYSARTLAQKGDQAGAGLALKRAGYILESESSCPDCNQSKIDVVAFSDEVSGDVFSSLGDYEKAVAFYLKSTKPGVAAKLEDAIKKRDADRVKAETAVNADGTPDVQKRLSALESSGNTALKEKNWDVAIEKFTEYFKYLGIKQVSGNMLSLGVAHAIRAAKNNSQADYQKAIYWFSLTANNSHTLTLKELFTQAVILRGICLYNLRRYQESYDTLKYLTVDDTIFQFAKSNVYSMILVEYPFTKFINPLYADDLELNGMSPSLNILLSNIIVSAKIAGVTLKTDPKLEELYKYNLGKSVHVYSVWIESWEKPLSQKEVDSFTIDITFIKLPEVFSYDPNNVKALMLRGRILRSYGLLENAKRDFERIIEISPENASLMRNTIADMSKSDTGVLVISNSKALKQVLGFRSLMRDIESLDEKFSAGNKKIEALNESLKDPTKYAPYAIQEAERTRQQLIGIRTQQQYVIDDFRNKYGSLLIPELGRRLSQLSANGAASIRN